MDIWIHFGGYQCQQFQRQPPKTNFLQFNFYIFSNIVEVIEEQFRRILTQPLGQFWLPPMAVFWLGDVLIIARIAYDLSWKTLDWMLRHWKNGVLRGRHRRPCVTTWLKLPYILRWNQPWREEVRHCLLWRSLSSYQGLVALWSDAGMNIAGLPRFASAISNLDILFFLLL